MSIKQKLTSTKKRRLSSRQWLERHINDPLVQQAKKEGLRSRAAYKLKEIDTKFHILKPGQTVIDLGAAPGGWSIVAANKVIRDNYHKTQNDTHCASSQKTLKNTIDGKIIALDILDFLPIPNVTKIIQDFTSDDAETQLKQALNNQKADVIMSDIAPNMTGNNITDRMRSEMLTELVLDFTLKVLKTNGHLIIKLFRGGYSKEFKAIVEKHFTSLRHTKPQSSRNQSSEIYLVARGFRKM